MRVRSTTNTNKETTEKQRNNRETKKQQRNMANNNNNNKSYDAEWEKKVEDYYTNVSYHEEWMTAVHEKDHEREVKEGISKPDEWYYTKKYGWFRKVWIKDAEEIAKEGWTDEW